MLKKGNCTMRKRAQRNMLQTISDQCYTDAQQIARYIPMLRFILMPFRSTLLDETSDSSCMLEPTFCPLRIKKLQSRSNRLLSKVYHRHHIPHNIVEPLPQREFDDPSMPPGSLFAPGELLMPLHNFQCCVRGLLIHYHACLRTS